MRIEQLTFTRFIAAFLIVIFHYGKKSPLFDNDYLGFIINQSNLGVSYFFVLSGFVMVIAYYNRKDINFLLYIKNRLARIYPVYFLAICIAFLGFYLTSNIKWDELILNILMVQTWVPGKSQVFNPPAWSLSVELFFYVLFPLLFNKYFKKKSTKKMIFQILFFWILSQTVYFICLNNQKILELIPESITFFKRLPILHLNEFLIGMLGGSIFMKHFLNVKFNTDFFLITIAVILILILKFNSIINLHNGALAIIYVVFLILLSINNGVISRLFKNKNLVLLGVVSYGIYILQAPFFSLISSYSVKKYFHINDYSIIFFSRLFLLIIMSVLIYIFFEMPIRKKIRNFIVTK
jgi:peptidoglycan/LPS O-acetylase OafA/YrhL